ncbi:AhpC/TSA family protein [Chitinophaga lutea]|uniref:AhpC/TSA family protein n=1 Tax=Chitinophaga lutea TaxID=2488634 RepID=A0A3N4QCM9_9BACT|nr:TlpA disulfide reductase family protein [Chitinophaga lutea]RPE09504.1 AhpC/TSA family protein [Chitinophaga lutea]
MKKLLMAAVLFSPVALFAQGKEKEVPYEVRGSIAQQEKPTKLYFRVRKDGKMFTDSVTTPDGRFLFAGTIPEPTTAQLFASIPSTPDNPMGRKEVAVLFIGGGTNTISISDIAAKPVTGGTKHQEAFNRLNSLTENVVKQSMELNKEYRALYNAKDEAGMKKLEARFEELEASHKAIMRKYLTDDPHSPIGMYVLNQVAGYELNVGEVEPLFNALSKEARATPTGKQFAYRLELAKKLSPGQPAIEFSQNDPEGKAVTLASFRGKYVLIDFWASWCGPCRAENPNVVSAFNKYKDKGFTILGVSFDENKEKWVEAVKKDQLTWTQVSDLKGWANEVGKLYGIRAIPQNLLLDPQGKIVAKNLRGEDLDSKLAELFK